MNTLIFRPALPTDIELIFGFLHQLAIHEGWGHKFKLTLPDLKKNLSGHANGPTVILCEQTGEVVGMAMWQEVFSVSSGGINLWLLDLFVAEAHRRKGVGEKLFEELKNIGHRHGYKRIDWFIMTGNASAQAFYRKMGGVKTGHTERWRMDIS